MYRREMLRRTLPATLVLTVLAWHQTSAEPAASQPVSTQPAADPAVDRILDRLEKKGDQIDSVTCQIVFIKIDPVLDDKQEYSGVLRFKKAKPNPKFFICFDEFKHEKVVRKQKEWHVFDGQWYIEAREGRDGAGKITKRQIVRPGETLEVFKIGQGPFPLPFGQKKADILKHFEVKLVPPAEGDPPHCDHLVCTPRPNTELAGKYSVVHFSIDRSLDLPVRVQTTEKEEGNEILAAFSKVQINPGLVESQLDLPELPEYQIETIPLPAPAGDKGPHPEQ